MYQAGRCTGICGSDLHYYQHFRNGDIQVREPMSLGHESAGVIVAIGNAVSSLHVGDVVALEVGVPCGSCDRCAENRYNICAGMRFRSSAKSFPHAQGTLQDFINHPAKWCHKMSPNVSLQLGALLEPLSVTIHAVQRSDLQPKAKVLVLGAGAIGLLAAAVCKIRGATVIIADLDEGRIKFAVENQFADYAFVMPTRRSSDVDEGLKMARETATEIGKTQMSGGALFGEVDVVFECTGVPTCAQVAIYVRHNAFQDLQCSVLANRLIGDAVWR